MQLSHLSGAGGDGADASSERRQYSVPEERADLLRRRLTAYAMPITMQAGRAGGTAMDTRSCGDKSLWKRCEPIRLNPARGTRLG